MVDGEDQEFEEPVDDGLFEDVDSFEGGDTVVEDGTGSDDGSGLGADQLDDGTTTNTTDDGANVN